MVAFLQKPDMIPVAVHRSREFQSNDIVDGRYRIVRKIAEGGMGTVFLAEHMLIKRRVAIKVLHAELAADREMIHRFLNEASAAGTLGHPHIVESTDMGFTPEGVPYIVFEYLEGCLLIEEIRRLGTLPVRRALLIVRQLASALEAAHNAEIAHLDLKSENVFLIDRDNVLDHAKLFDFGISRFMAAESETTQSGILMGTPEFMAPEQVTSPDTVDGRADIYALGVLLYEMVTGRCPFVSDDPRWVLYQVIHERPPPLERPVPLAFESLLFDGLLVKSREQRLQTMGEVITILDALIAETPSGVPDALDTFDESETENASAISPVWAVESWFDNAPTQLDSPGDRPSHVVIRPRPSAPGSRPTR